MTKERLLTFPARSKQKFCNFRNVYRETNFTQKNIKQKNVFCAKHIDFLDSLVIIVLRNYYINNIKT